jgi:hypothetical protein
MPAIAFAQVGSSGESGVHSGALPTRSDSEAKTVQVSNVGGEGDVLDGTWKGTTTAYCGEHVRSRPRRLPFPPF